MNIGAETEWIEFKKTTGELKEGIVSIASMLNKNGYGTLYFGVKDNGDVLGQQIGDRTLREVSQAIANFVKPQIIPTITLELMDERNVIKVYAEGIDTPYSAYGKYYMRSADEDRELTPEQLRNLLLRKVELDPIIKIPAGTEELSFAQLKTLFAVKGLSINADEFEKNLDLKRSDGSYNYMAELLADRNDVSVKVVTFSGQDKSNVIRRNEYGFKCLLTAMDQVLSYVESIDDTAVRIGGHQREEQLLFDMSAFREAWVNACLHTRWDRKNPPAVYIFSDRLEIISTGGLPADLTKEEFYRGISKPVNQKLQKIFGQLGYVEQTGHGIPLIISKYGMQAFDISQNFITVTIPFAYLDNAKRIMNDKAKLNKSQLAVLNLLMADPTYTIKDIVANTEFSDGYVRKLLAQLKTAGYIKRVGSNKSGYWSIEF